MQEFSKLQTRRVPGLATATQPENIQRYQRQRRPAGAALGRGNPVSVVHVASRNIVRFRDSHGMNDAFDERGRRWVMKTGRITE
jgi:hypothetical protein